MTKIKQDIYDMTPSQLQSEVKRINQRYVDLKKEYGEQNELVKTYKKWMNEVSTVGTTKSGNLSIKSPSKLTEEDKKVINILSNLQTKGEYKESKKNLFKNLFGRLPKTYNVKDENGKAKKVDELKDFITESSDLHEFIVNNGTFIYNASTSLKDALKRSGSLSYSEYNELLEIYKKYKSGEDIGDIAKEEAKEEKTNSINDGTLEE